MVNNSAITLGWFFFKIILFIYFWLRWVSVAVQASLQFW